MKIANSLWVEKYRPRQIEQLVLPDNYKKDFIRDIKEKEIPHLLLAGQPGSGKTALSLIICSNDGIIFNSEDNVLKINGSAKQSRGINFVDEVIEPYLKIPVAKPDKYKIVFIDEADFLTDAAFSSMRHIMEKYSSHSRFILTCNYVSKIPEAIQSRCQSYMFKQMPVDFVVDYCKNILESEKIDFEEKDLKFVVEALYPDIRRIVNTIQQSSRSGKLITDRNSVLSNEKIIISNIVEIISFIKNGENHKINNSINSLVKIMGDTDLDFRSIYNDLFFRDGIPTTAKIIINKYSNGHADCLLPHMHFLAGIFEVIQALQKYNQLIGKK